MGFCVEPALVPGPIRMIYHVRRVATGSLPSVRGLAKPKPRGSALGRFENGPQNFEKEHLCRERDFDFDSFSPTQLTTPTL
jgi:hypothetical protein